MESSEVAVTSVVNNRDEQGQNHSSAFDFSSIFESLQDAISDRMAHEAEQVRDTLDDGAGHIEPSKLSSLLSQANADSLLAKQRLKGIEETIEDMLCDEFYLDADEASEMVADWLGNEIERMECSLDTIRQAFVVLLGFYTQAQGHETNVL